MQQKTPEISEISENLLEKLLKEIPDLLNYMNFTSIPS